MTDAALMSWMQSAAGGYRLRGRTAAIWLGVLRTFDQQGTPMTVRGLFYALEMLGLVPKSEAGYRQVCYQVLQMRRRGVIPFDFISDGTRYVLKPRTYSGLGAYLQRGQEAYRRALWDNQRDYVEVWCEKDAIAGILHQITEPWDVALYVARGYPSETFCYTAADCLKAQDKPAHIYYFGDMDPSGWNISETLERKLRDFGAAFTFERVAVLPWQVIDMNLPTRPAKPKDTRAKGWEWPCVEVDAIPANRLRELCETVIMRHIDRKAHEDTLQAERLEKQAFAKMTEWWRQGNDNLLHKAGGTI